MCTSCRHAVKRHVAPLLLIPALTVSQPMARVVGDAIITSVMDDEKATVVQSPLVPGAYAAEDSQDGAQKWTCPMHPHYIADAFGTCPICGMDLVKLDTGDSDLEATTATSREVITVAPEVVQSMGVRLSEAEQSQFGRTVRSYGIVTENERLQTDITSRVEGWVTELKTTAVGDEVSAGGLLFKLYAPQLVVSQNDYLRSGSADLRRRGINQLRALGVQEAAIDRMREGKEPMQDVPFFADRNGVVAELNIREGTYVKRGMLLARIQDYASVWLIVGVPEKDLGFIDQNTRATVTFPSLPGREVRAKVDFVYPTIDEKTRTGRVRLVIDNQDGRIRPGSYADVVFEVGTAIRISARSRTGSSSSSWRRFRASQRSLWLGASLRSIRF
ncbi:efflux RND transporter periplasmic adaptor subunit [Dichotomicrobium thermohalophilum]|uniref:Multidrug efflux pump subunit AcrA (Membrane-fusion protein) n=1 Tax=Dichotomicrobium thermohalophilum TaxID=933063 RepID=A0A397Q546_9HYPH|nr:efflux RND transporter periplasmic adaptor subunit [Dichotomicrobium thermohalophilum]RIA56073.1 multidrug efflux pump subunit AcrA (membrane-fusion protein) [Dichotomicrobium thermohalophilum]